MGVFLPRIYSSARTFKVLAAIDPEVFIAAVPTGNVTPQFMWRWIGRHKRAVAHSMTLLIEPRVVERIGACRAPRALKGARRKRSLAGIGNQTIFGPTAVLHTVRKYSEEEGVEHTFWFREAVYQRDKQRIKLRGYLLVSTYQVMPAYVFLGQNEAWIEF